MAAGTIPISSPGSDPKITRQRRPPLPSLSLLRPSQAASPPAAGSAGARLRSPAQAGSEVGWMGWSFPAGLLPGNAGGAALLSCPPGKERGWATTARKKPGPPGLAGLRGGVGESVPGWPEAQPLPSPCRGLVHSGVEGVCEAPDAPGLAAAPGRTKGGAGHGQFHRTASSPSPDAKGRLSVKTPVICVRSVPGGKLPGAWAGRGCGGGGRV